MDYGTSLVSLDHAIIDIHTHIVYGIDDGAVDFEESIRLIGMEYDQGVRGIFCTSHSYGMLQHHEDYHRNLGRMKSAAQARYPDLSLYKGCEVLCTKHRMPEIIQKIKDGIFPTLNGTRYVLTEFSPLATAGMEEMRYCLECMLDKGLIPVIAHAERYEAIYDDPLNDVAWMKEFGCLIQINLFSVKQDTGWRKELANAFLEHHIVDFVGTDTHNLGYKSPQAAIGAAAIRNYGTQYANRVLYGNAIKTINTRVGNVIHE